MSRDSRDGWDLPLFRPKMGRQPSGTRPASGLPLRRAVLQRLARSVGAGRAFGSRTGEARARVRCDIRLPPGLARRCVVKARYVAMSAGGMKAARAHLAYIERDGVERDGTQGRLFDAAGEVQRAEFGVAIEGEKRQFRFIIAPEDGDELDLRDYTRRLVDRMEKDLGRRLRWAAVCHYNTDNPHVHLVVRGVDSQDRELRIDRTYLSESLRLRAQELATNELGPRSDLDVGRQLDREVSQERLTGIDRRLAVLCTAEGIVRIADIAKAAEGKNLSRPHALGRLTVLEQLHLAERVSPTSWRLEDGWQEALQHLGERGDIIKRMLRALRRTPVAFRIFDPTNVGTIDGVVRHKGLHDEQSGAPFIIIESARKEAHYVRVDPADASGLAVGNRVRVVATPAKWLTAPDQVIQRVAAANLSVYDATVHLRDLEARPVLIDGRPASPRSIVEANMRRLKRLERFKLAKPLADGRWQVPPNLVEILRDRERTHPQFRVQIERPDRGTERPVAPPRNRGSDRGG